MGDDKQSSIQTHHIATDKIKITKFQNKIFNNGDWNKVKMPHRGRHPNEYHEYILEKMSKIDKIARGDKDKFLKEFEKLKEEVKTILLYFIKITIRKNKYYKMMYN
nr:AHH domain-containing protein [Campylobacter jejuni]